PPAKGLGGLRTYGSCETTPRHCEERPSVEVHTVGGVTLSPLMPSVGARRERRGNLYLWDVFGFGSKAHVRLPRRLCGGAYRRHGSDRCKSSCRNYLHS